MRSLILQNDEEVVRVFRQSPAVLLFPATVSLVAVLLPLWYAVKYSLFERLDMWIALWALVVAAWFVQKLFLWHREKYVVTTARFVKTTHETVFKQIVTETALDRMLNISFRTTGPWSVLAGFGDIDLQVVGMMEPIVVKSVRRPAVVKEFLWRLHEKTMTGRAGGHAASYEYVKPNQPLL